MISQGSSTPALKAIQGAIDIHEGDNIQIASRLRRATASLNFPKLHGPFALRENSP
jgi:hypothetical protein